MQLCMRTSYMAASALRLPSLCRSWRCCNMQLVPQLPSSCRAVRVVGYSNRSDSCSVRRTLWPCDSGARATRQQQHLPRLSTLTKASHELGSTGSDSDLKEYEEAESSTAANINSINDTASSSINGSTAVKLQLQQDKPVRVERLLANLGYGKRQECAVLLKRRRVVYAATGKPAKVGEKAVAGDLLLDGEPLDPPPPMSIILHKPVGYVVTSPDDENISDPKIYDLLPYRFGRRRPFLSAIGRLDKETSGLLLLTDDGKLLHSIQSPARGIWKLYTAELAAALVGKEAAAAVRKFGSGSMMLQGDRGPLLPAGLRMLSDTTAEVAICEGRYHQIRRMFAAIGHEVVALHRHAIGGLGLTEQGLPEGEWRFAELTDLTAVLSGPDMTDSIKQQQQPHPDDQEPKQQRHRITDVAGAGQLNGRRSSSSKSRSRDAKGEGMPDQQPVAEEAGSADFPAAAWYAASSSRSSSEEEQAEREEYDESYYEQIQEEGQAVRRYKKTLKWAKRRASIARGVKSVRWQKEEHAIE